MLLMRIKIFLASFSEYERIDVSERIVVNKTKELRRCIIRNYYYFFGKILDVS